MITAGRYAASLEPKEREATLESAFFVALVAQGFGTISGKMERVAETRGACCLSLDLSTHKNAVADNKLESKTERKDALTLVLLRQDLKIYVHSSCFVQRSVGT